MIVEEEKSGWHLPGWVKELGFKLLPWALMAIIGAGLTLYMDNVGNKRDIARNSWRLDQQEARINRQEARQDRLESAYSELNDSQEEFQGEALDRLDKLLGKERRRK